jgi:phage shock protein B
VEDGLAVFAILIGASLIMFVIFVMPIWIILHYKSRNRPLPQPAVPHAVSDRDAADLITAADRMEQRVMALEAIMDAEAPGWRAKS